MITVLLLVDRHRRNEPVLITPQALAYQGSGVGVLPRGKRIPLETMLNGLLLVSGNDAAIALAQHDAGSVGRFVHRMNREARALGLRCSHFNRPDGYLDRGNHSRPVDLAELARGRPGSTADPQDRRPGPRPLPLSDQRATTSTSTTTTRSSASASRGSPG